MNTIFTHSTSIHPRRAFTLVELLVVIGIIALLISILLPALNRARESASSVKCQANLKTMGQALYIYTTQSKGTLPFGAVFNNDIPAPISYGGATPRWTEESQEWTTLLLYGLSNKDGASYDANSSVTYNLEGRRRMFLCPTVTITPTAKSAITHYSAHPRLFPHLVSVERYKTTGATTSKPRIKSRKISSIKRAAETAAFFDGTIDPQIAGTGAWSATVLAFGLDKSALGRSPYLIDDPVLGATGNPVYKSGDPIDLTPVGLSGNVDQWFNTDSKENGGNIRFRHNKDTAVNVLMLDGHVQVFKYNKQTKSTDLLKRNVYVSAGG